MCRTTVSMRIVMAVFALTVSAFGQEKPELFVQTGHIGPVTAIACTPDGKYCISYCPNSVTMMSRQAALKLWDVQSGRGIKTLFTESAIGMVFIDLSPDGIHVVVLVRSQIEAGYGTLQIINTVTEETKTLVIRDKKGGFEPVTATISVDNKTVHVLYSNSFLAKSVLKSFDIATGKELETITGGVYVQNFMPPGSRFYLRYDQDLDQYSRAKVLPYWLSALAGGKKTKKVQLNLSDLPAPRAAFSHDGHYGVLISNGTMYFVDCAEGTMNTIATTESQELFDISPDGRYLLTYVPAKAIRIFDSFAGKNIQTIAGSFQSAIFSPNGNTILTGDKAGDVCLYDITSGQRTRSFGTKPRQQNMMAISFDRYMLSLSTIGAESTWDWFVWDLQKASLLKAIHFKGNIQQVLPYADIGSLNKESATAQIMVAMGSTSANKTYTASFSEAAQGVQVLDANTKKEIARCTIFDDGEWIIMTPEGYFNASANGAKHINVRAGRAVYSVDNFYEKFFNPAYVASVLQGRKVEAVADIRKGFALPPQVTITSPAPNTELTSDVVTITISAKDMGGGIDEIRLYQNEKLISEDQRGMKNIGTMGETVIKSYQVTLLSGINTFRALAFNRERTESNPDEIKVDLKAAQAASDLYLFAIGINEYKNGKYNLNFGKSDAMAFLNMVVQKSRTIFKKAFEYQLYDGEATRPAIEAIFRTIAATAKPQDAFVFFYAGHGVMSEGSEAVPSDFHLIPADVTQLYGNDPMLAAKAISAAQLKTFCTTIKAQKQLVVLDACQSGGAVASFAATRGASEERAIMQLARSAGTVLLASTGTDQFATEFATLAHGVFTYALLQGLNGDADGGNPKDGKITVKELEAYLNDQVPELTKKYRGTAQYPNSCARGQDFPLGVK